jgi:hypothetical protein
MSLVEKKLNVVIATCHLCNPFVVIVDSTMVPLDTKNVCIFIEGGLWNDGLGKSGTTFLGAVFEAGRHVFPSMHLTIMDPLCKITRHDDVKVGVIRFCVRLEEPSIVVVLFINRVGVLWETFPTKNTCVGQFPLVVGEFHLFHRGIMTLRKSTSWEGKFESTIFEGIFHPRLIWAKKCCIGSELKLCTDLSNTT